VQQSKISVNLINNLLVFQLKEDYLVGVIMNKLIDSYVKDMTAQGVSLSEAPKVKILDNKADKKTIDSYVREHFRPIISIYDEQVDIFISLNNSPECLDVSFLTVYGKEDGKSIFFYSKIDPKNASSFFNDLNYGEEIYIHSKGKDFDEAIARANSRVPLRIPSDALREIVSKEIDRLDTWYESKGFNCIDFKLNLKKGIHGRPSSYIVGHVAELKSKGIVDEDNLVYISNKKGEISRTDSIMNVLLMDLSYNSIATVYSKSKEAVNSLYEFIKNMDPDA
jgi:phosphotransferase system HPr-like phosphotransfer protein